MKTTKRYNNAVKVLYTAYHNGTLDAMNCKHCAVGNLCNNDDSWAEGVCIGYSYGFGCPARIPDDYIFNNPSNYSNKELREIESIFIKGVPDAYKNFNNKFSNNIRNNDVLNGIRTKKEQKELQFKGLCAVIEYLAELDGIENPFNFDNLFNDDIIIAEKELQLI